jgi:hydrogenase maturation protein HypF
LRDAFGDNIPETLPLFSAVSPRELKVVNAMLDKRLNTIQTSSCGRLFDAVASIIGLQNEVNFEGQAAIKLECQAGNEEGVYPFDIPALPEEIDFRATIEAIVREVLASESVSSISSRFHNTLVAAIVETCRKIRKGEGLKRVCLSGGVFQNRTARDGRI